MSQNPSSPSFCPSADGDALGLAAAAPPPFVNIIDWRPGNVEQGTPMHLTIRIREKSAGDGFRTVGPNGSPSKIVLKKNSTSGNPPEQIEWDFTDADLAPLQSQTGTFDYELTLPLTFNALQTPGATLLFSIYLYVDGDHEGWIADRHSFVVPN
jgi:hypothetical protein